MLNIIGSAVLAVTSLVGTFNNPNGGEPVNVPDNPNVVVSWGTGDQDEDEDDLVVTVDGSEVLRIHVDELTSGNKLVAVDREYFNGYYVKL